MKTIFLNRYFYPDHSATSQMLTELSLALAEKDYDIHIITSRLLYNDTEKLLPKYECINNVHIHRVRTSRFGRLNLVGRMIDYLSYYFFAIIKLCFLASKGDVVVAKTDPPLMSIILAPLMKLKRVRYINWLQDVFPEVAMALDVGGRITNPVFVFLKWLRNYSLKISSMNIVLGQVMAEHLKNSGVPENKITIIPNWSDGSVVYPVEPRENDLRKAWGLNDKFVVGYSGNLGRAHDFNTIIQAAEILSNQSESNESAKNIIFLFIGGGAQHQKVQNEITQRNLNNIYLKPYQPKEQLALSLSTPDVHLVCLKPQLEGFIVPSKFYGIAAAGRGTLFIGDAEGEVPRILNQENLGITFSEGDDNALAQKILDLSQNYEKCKEIGKRARTLFEKDYDKTIAVSRWDRLIGESIKVMKGIP